MQPVSVRIVGVCMKHSGHMRRSVEVSVLLTYIQNKTKHSHTTKQARVIKPDED